VISEVSRGAFFPLEIQFTQVFQFTQVLPRNLFINEAHMLLRQAEPYTW
jgi:hypothetical protein